MDMEYGYKFVTLDTDNKDKKTLIQLLDKQDSQEKYIFNFKNDLPLLSKLKYYSYLHKNGVIVARCRMDANPLVEEQKPLLLKLGVTVTLTNTNIIDMVRVDVIPDDLLGGGHGKRLCTRLLEYTMERLVDLNEKFFMITNESQSEAACRCYLGSAIKHPNLLAYTVFVTPEGQSKLTLITNFVSRDATCNDDTVYWKYLFINDPGLKALIGANEQLDYAMDMPYGLPGYQGGAKYKKRSRKRKTIRKKSRRKQIIRRRRTKKKKTKKFFYVE